MENLIQKITLEQTKGSTLFYNTHGSKKAYQLGVKHISASEFLGFSLALPNGDLLITKEFILVDFETNELCVITKGQKVQPLELKSV